MLNTIYSDKIKVNCPLVHDEDGYFYLVYQVTNLVNGKIYIGKHSTKNPYDKYMGSGKAIKQAIKKYGTESFTKEILYCFTNEKEAFLKEEELVTQDFIDREDTYNITFGGKGLQSGEKNLMYGKPSAMRGRHHTQESREKMSKATKGKLHSQETKDKISKANKGKRLSQETKDKISKANKGKFVGENSPLFGKPKSQETKDKISKANKGKLAGEKNPMYGKRGENSPIFGEKNGMYGKKHSQETRDKISKNHADASGEKNPMYGRRGENSPVFGEKNPSAKSVIKKDEDGNVIAKYGTVKDCCAQECVHPTKLRKIIKEHILYKGFYFEFEHKN